MIQKIHDHNAFSGKSKYITKHLPLNNHIAKTNKQRRRAGNNCVILSRSGAFAFDQGHVKDFFCNGFFGSFVKCVQIWCVFA